LQQAVTNGYIRSNPCVGTVLPRVEKPNIKPLTDEQVAALLKAADNDLEYGSIIKLTVLTGLRECEALGLTWDCVDFEKGCITINKQLQKRPKSAGGFAFAPLKNDKVRVIKPAPFVMEMLKARYSQQAAQRLSAAEAWVGWKNESERRNYLVFTTLIGEHLGPNTFYNHFKKLAAQIGAPDARVHDMRHTYAVLSLQNGDDIKTVQGNLGHATASFTLDVYGHVSEQMKDASAQRMQQYLDKLAVGSAQSDKN
jgi:integrase